MPWPTVCCGQIYNSVPDLGQDKKVRILVQIGPQQTVGHAKRKSKDFSYKFNRSRPWAVQKKIIKEVSYKSDSSRPCARPKNKNEDLSLKKLTAAYRGTCQKNKNKQMYSLLRSVL